MAPWDYCLCGIYISAFLCILYAFCILSMNGFISSVARMSSFNLKYRESTWFNLKFYMIRIFIFFWVNGSSCFKIIEGGFVRDISNLFKSKTIILNIIWIYQNCKYIIKCLSKKEPKWLIIYPLFKFLANQSLWQGVFC
jgi:hypothetical protein